tara:strand:+ start:906 stop:1172 length:267 start_codon:yes stop_codon:yes gene_type:complete
MSIKLKNLIKSEQKIKNKEPLIAEGFWSKLTSLFGSKNKDKVSKLKKNRKFMSLLKGLNNNWDNIAKHIEDEYGQKVKFEKFTIDDFK